MVPYLSVPLARATMVPCDAVDPSVDAFPARFHSLAVALDFDCHRSRLYAADVASNGSMVSVNCPVEAVAEYFSLAHDSYHFVGPVVPSFVDMVEIESVEQRDSALVECRDIGRDR